jgi:hypothetical protein
LGAGDNSSEQDWCGQNGSFRFAGVRTISGLCWYGWFGALAWKEKGENPVADAVFTVLTVGFFVLAIAYLHGCERLK